MALGQKTSAIMMLALLASPAQSQEMRPIVDLFQIQPSQVFVRCAGLYSALAAWVGEERMGADWMNAMEGAMQTNLAAAVTAYQIDGIGNSDQQRIDMAARDVNSAYELYTDRFSRNVAASGEAFGQDAMVQSDLETCQVVTERFSQ